MIRVFVYKVSAGLLNIPRPTKSLHSNSLNLGVRQLIYVPAAKNPKSKFVEVGGGHKDTGRLAVGQIVSWLKSL